jgi:glutathione S-transferase
MMRLHDNVSSGNGYKVRLLLAQLGVPFERIEYDIDRAETRTPEFLREINPNGRVPVLETGNGEFLPESNAILFYLADGTPYLPDERFERARVLQWMFFEQYSHEPYIATTRFIVRHLPSDSPRRAEITDRKKRGYDALAVMEKHLATRRFFVDERYSIADIALYAYTHVADQGTFDLRGYPNVLAWLGRVKDQPKYVPITYRQTAGA